MIARCNTCGAILHYEHAQLAWRCRNWFMPLIPELSKTLCFVCKIKDAEERIHAQKNMHRDVKDKEGSDKATNHVQDVAGR